MLFCCRRDGRSCHMALRLANARYFFKYRKVSQTQRVLHSAFNTVHCKEAVGQWPERLQWGAERRLT